MTEDLCLAKIDRSRTVKGDISLLVGYAVTCIATTTIVAGTLYVATVLASALHANIRAEPSVSLADSVSGWLAFAVALLGLIIAMASFEAPSFFAPIYETKPMIVAYEFARRRSALRTIGLVAFGSFGSFAAGLLAAGYLLHSADFATLGLYVVPIAMAVPLRRLVWYHRSRTLIYERICQRTALVARSPLSGDSTFFDAAWSYAKDHADDSRHICAVINARSAAIRKIKIIV